MELPLCSRRLVAFFFNVQMEFRFLRTVDRLLPLKPYLHLWSHISFTLCPTATLSPVEPFTISLSHQTCHHLDRLPSANLLRQTQPGHGAQHFHELCLPVYLPNPQLWPASSPRSRSHIHHAIPTPGPIPEAQWYSEANQLKIKK